jgi:protein dithiol oxidoreductase (disulfide-forming)
MAFMKIAAPLMLIASFALAAPVAPAAEPVEGKDYFQLNPALATADPAKLVVTEFFSYECPHCYRFAKPFAAWTARLPADVKAERAAVAIGHESWKSAAQAFYALTALQAVPKIDDAFFGAVHRDRKPLADEASITAWAAEQGIDRAAFQNAFRSFSVQLQMKRADDFSRQARLPSVPALLIDGRYLIAIADDGDFNDQLALADTLIKRARGERAAAAQAKPRT